MVFLTLLPAQAQPNSLPEMGRREFGNLKS